MKRVLTLLLSICLVLGVSATAFAVDDMCTIRVFSGVQGAIDGGSVKSYQVKRGDSFSQITAIDGYAVCPKGSKYYPKGLRESGKEETHALSFRVTKDQDFVVTYGIKGEQVAYYVEYVDENGNPLPNVNKSGPFYANKGDKVYVAYVEVPNYQPDYPNRAGTLNDESRLKQADGTYLFTFKYTRVSTNTGNTGTGNTGTGGQVNPVTPVNPANPANPANPNNPANPTNPANPANPANPNNPNGPAGPTNNGTNGTENGPGNQNPGETIEIFDEDVPLAGPGSLGGTDVSVTPSVIEPQNHNRLPSWALILLAVLLTFLIALLYWYLLFYRKKKKYAEEDVQIIDYDDDDF